MPNNVPNIYPNTPPPCPKCHIRRRQVKEQNQGGTRRFYYICTILSCGFTEELSCRKCNQLMHLEEFTVGTTIQKYFLCPRYPICPLVEFEVESVECPTCDRPMHIRQYPMTSTSLFLYSCSGFPECSTRLPLDSRPEFAGSQYRDQLFDGGHDISSMLLIEERVNKRLTKEQKDL